MTTQATDFEARRAALRQAYLKPFSERARTTARGVHHLALICSDVERTIQFYQGVLGFPLVELVENRDVLVSESGVDNSIDIKKLAEGGVRAVLVGESLMRSDDIPAKIRSMFGV